MVSDAVQYSKSGSRNGEGEDTERRIAAHVAFLSTLGKSGPSPMARHHSRASVRVAPCVCVCADKSKKRRSSGGPRCLLRRGPKKRAPIKATGGRATWRWKGGGGGANCCCTQRRIEMERGRPGCKEKPRNRSRHPPERRTDKRMLRQRGRNELAHRFHLFFLRRAGERAACGKTSLGPPPPRSELQHAALENGARGLAARSPLTRAPHTPPFSSDAAAITWRMDADKSKNPSALSATPSSSPLPEKHIKQASPSQPCRAAIRPVRWAPPEKCKNDDQGRKKRFGSCDISSMLCCIWKLHEQ
ncbi:hypothetical protein MRX96_027103 [Rhipicephalus microplus]